jgi:DNA-directed RNA polymerase specialized sigma24 family protein
MLVFLLADMDLSEEEELVKRAQKDPDAFAKLYDQYYPKIFGYVLRRSANLEAAQDIFGDILKGIGEALAISMAQCLFFFVAL